MKSVGLLVVALIGTAWLQPEARAGVLRATALARATTVGEFSQGMDFAEAYATDLTSSARAVAQSDVHNMVNASARATNTEAYAESIWRDRVLLTGPINTVDSTYLTFTFQVTASITATSEFGAPVGRITSGAGNSFDGVQFGGSYSYGPDRDEVQGLWTSVAFGGGNFVGEYQIRVTLGELGTGERYQDWWVGYGAYVTSFFPNRAGTVVINGGDPPSFDFTRVTLPDGRTPEEAGFTLAFESGLASPNGVAAVPEPGSLTLLGAGISAAGWFGWRRRKRPASA